MNLSLGPFHAVLCRFPTCLNDLGQGIEAKKPLAASRVFSAAEVAGNGLGLLGWPAADGGEEGEEC